MGQIAVSTKKIDRPIASYDGRYIVYGTYALSNSYGPAAETITAKSLGLSVIETLIVSPAVNIASPSLSLLPVVLDREPKGQMSVYVPTATNGQDLSNMTGWFVAVGF